MMREYKDSIVQLNESNKGMILDFIGENVIHYYGEPWSVKTEEIRENSKKTMISNYEKEIEQNKLKIFACIMEETVLGTIAVKNDLYLQLLFVKKEAQRMGIGTALVDHVKGLYNNLTALSGKDEIPFCENNGFFIVKDAMDNEDTAIVKYLENKKEQTNNAVKK